MKGTVGKCHVADAPNMPGYLWAQVAFLADEVAAAALHPPGLLWRREWYWQDEQNGPGFPRAQRMGRTEARAHANVPRRGRGG